MATPVCTPDDDPRALSPLSPRSMPAVPTTAGVRSKSLPWRALGKPPAGLKRSTGTADTNRRSPDWRQTEPAGRVEQGERSARLRHLPGAALMGRGWCTALADTARDRVPVAGRRPATADAQGRRVGSGARGWPKACHGGRAGTPRPCGRATPRGDAASCGSLLGLRTPSDPPVILTGSRPDARGWVASCFHAGLRPAYKTAQATPASCGLGWRADGHPTAPPTRRWHEGCATAL
jgi:hypothetical protein